MSGVSPSYDDIPEIRYHFPRRYLNQAERCLGDWIVYCEPRQGGGRMCYFATARVDRIEPDPRISDHFYAFVSDYLEFPAPVDYREGTVFHESALRKPDGSVNKGSLGWAIRHLPDHEYMEIIRLGMEPAAGSVAGKNDEALKPNGMVRESDADLEIRTLHPRSSPDRIVTGRSREESKKPTTTHVPSLGFASSTAADLARSRPHISGPLTTKVPTPFATASPCRAHSIGALIITSSHLMTTAAYSLRRRCCRISCSG